LVLLNDPISIKMTTFIEEKMYYELNQGEYTGEKPTEYHKF